MADRPVQRAFVGMIVGIMFHTDRIALAYLPRSQHHLRHRAFLVQSKQPRQQRVPKGCRPEQPSLIAVIVFTMRVEELHGNAVGQVVPAIPANVPPTPRPNTVSPCRSSNCLKPSAASSCCRGAGWSSDHSPGRPASAASSKTMNTMPKPPPDFMPSLSLAS